MIPLKIKLMVILVAIALVGLIGYAVLPINNDPMVEVMAILEDHSKLCIHEIKQTGVAGDECRLMLIVSDKIFEGDAPEWGRTVKNNGMLNVSNAHVVERALAIHTVAIKLIRLTRNAPQTSI